MKFPRKFVLASASCIVLLQAIGCGSEVSHPGTANSLVNQESFPITEVNVFSLEPADRCRLNHSLKILSEIDTRFASNQLTSHSHVDTAKAWIWQQFENHQQIDPSSLKQLLIGDKGKGPSLPEGLIERPLEECAVSCN